jgi:hypothetical protein
METDDLRAHFLSEFDAMSDYVAPTQDLRPLPQPDDAEVGAA